MDRYGQKEWAVHGGLRFASKRVVRVPNQVTVRLDHSYDGSSIAPNVSCQTIDSGARTKHGGL